MMKRTTTTIDTARREVRRALEKGPRTGRDLRDDLAARCGSKENVGRGIGELARCGVIVEHERSGCHVTWKLVESPPAAEVAA